jgi:tetratricopeptide (TPR) repeat protein
LRDHASAIQNFDRAIELNPKYANAYRNRGAARKAAGDAPGAAADLERAKQLEK